MKAKTYFIIFGIVSVLLIGSLFFIPTNDKDVIVTVTIEKPLNILEDVKIKNAETEIVQHKILSLASMTNVFTLLDKDMPNIVQSGDLKLVASVGERTKTEKIDKLWTSDKRVEEIKITKIDTELSTVFVNLYEDGELKDSVEVNL